MLKRMGKKLAILLAITVFLACFGYAPSTEAASNADMAKANVKWDLKPDKTIKFKTFWYALGEKQHTVKMTNFTIKDAKKKGYKVCSFNLTFTRKKMTITDRQVTKMGTRIENYGSFGGEFYFAVVDYQTGKSLESENDKGVTVKSSGWKHSKPYKRTAKNGAWIRYPRKSTIKVTIVYPKDYDDLAIGVGGMTTFKGNSDKFFSGNKKFSKETRLYSKTDKNYAHFMLVKNQG